MDEKAIVTTNAGELDPAKVQLIKDMVAPGCEDNEFALLMHLAQKYKLDPLARQIWAVKLGNSPALIFVGRDGYLQNAHASGQFDGMESGTRKNEDGEIFGWARVYRKDMKHPFQVEVLLSEYERKYSDKTPADKRIWENKPRTMIQKVAEAQALRRAFSISGIYSPEEIDEGPHDMQPCSCEPTEVREVNTEVNKPAEEGPVERRQPGIPEDVKITKMGSDQGDRFSTDPKGRVVQHEGKWITRKEFEKIQQQKAGVEG